MYCSHCGKKISDTSRFCRYCGAPVEPEEGSFPENDNKASEDNIWPGKDDFGLNGEGFTEVEDFDYEDSGHDPETGPEYFREHGKNRKRERNRDCSNEEAGGTTEIPAGSLRPGDDFEESSHPGGTGSSGGQTSGKMSRQVNPSLLVVLGIVSVLCLFLFLRNGSGTNSSPSQESVPANTVSKGELTVCIWDENQKEGLQQIMDEWTAQSGVKVNLEVVSWADYWTKLESQAAGGDLPDVFWMHSASVQTYMESGLLLNLDAYIADDSAIDLGNYYEDIVDIYRSPDNGAQYALPKDHDTIALLYNKNIFDYNGLEYPSEEWTWEDLREVAMKNAELGVYGFAMDVSNTQDGWYNILYGYGGKIITDDRKGSTIGSTEGKEGMEVVRRILEVSVPYDEVHETGVEKQFLDGRCAMILQGSWMAGYYYNILDTDSYGWAMLPYADANNNGSCDEGERCTIYNGIGWAAAADTKMPDEAYSLISYLCSEAGQKKQAELGISMAAMKGLHEEFLNAFEGVDVSAFTRIEEEGTLYLKPYTRNTFDWENVMQIEAFQMAWEFPSEPEVMLDACDKAQQVIEYMINQN